MLRIIGLCFVLSAFVACGGEDEPAVPEAAPLPSNSSNAGGEELFTDLPSNIQTDISSCQNQARFYDLRTFTCTDAVIASFPCDAENSQLKAALTARGQQDLINYLGVKDPELKLYGCTLETKLLLLHYYKLESTQVTYNVLKLEAL